MDNFIFEYPTKVYFGNSSVKEQLANALKPYGSRIMLAYGGGSIKNNGIYKEITEILEKDDKEVIDFSGIMSNPTYAKAQEGSLPTHLKELKTKTQITDDMLKDIADSTNIITTGYGVLTHKEIYNILKECI